MDSSPQPTPDPKTSVSQPSENDRSSGADRSLPIVPTPQDTRASTPIVGSISQPAKTSPEVQLGNNDSLHRYDGFKSLVAPMLFLVILVGALSGGWFGYRYITGQAGMVTIDGHKMQVVTMTSGDCKGRLKVAGKTYMGGSFCLDNKAMATSHAAMMMANPRPSYGMVYGGLQVASPSSPCAGEFELSDTKVNGQPMCTHGPDPTDLPTSARAAQPAPIPALGESVPASPVTGTTSLPTQPIDNAGSVDTSQSAGTDTATTVSATDKAHVNFAIRHDPVYPHVQTAAVSLPTASFPLYGCVQPGGDGRRIQVLYTHFSTQPDRLSTYLGLIASNVREDEQIYANSASLNDGIAHLRWLTDGNCNISVTDVTIPASPTAPGPDAFWTVIHSLTDQGFSNSLHKYMVFVDSPTNDYCGLTTNVAGTTPAGQNPSDYSAGYATVEPECWGYGHAMGHELTHTFGAVASSTPNSSHFGHCTDVHDMMCYMDAPTTVIQQKCFHDYPDSNILDCDADDYFNAHPAAGSYLATNWNVYNSQYIVHQASPQLNPRPSIVTFKNNTATDTWYFKRGIDYSLQYIDNNNLLAGWHNLGGQWTSAPTAISYGSNTVMVFIRGKDNAIYARSYSNGNWGNWSIVGVYAASNVAAVSRQPGSVDFFYRGATNQLITRSWNQQTGWGPLLTLGGSVGADPAVVSNGANDLEVFATAPATGAPSVIVWHGKSWSAWVSLGTSGKGSVAAVAVSTTNTTMFVSGGNDQIYSRTLLNGHWQPWIKLGGITTTSPAVGLTNGVINVYIRGRDSNIYKRSYANGGWGAQFQLVTNSKALTSGDMVTGTNGLLAFRNTAGLSVLYQDTASPATVWEAPDSSSAISLLGSGDAPNWPNYSN